MGYPQTSQIGFQGIDVVFLRAAEAADPTYMWISVRSAGTMAVVFALPAFNSGDTCVSGTLAAVRGTPAR